MATEIINRMVDDLDGKSEATETVTFTARMGGRLVEREIDLKDSNAKRLRKLIAELETAQERVLAEFVAASRPVVVANKRTRAGRALRHSRPTGRGRRAHDNQSKVIRAWAEANGYTVAPRGRISDEITSAFMAANR